MPPGWDAVTGRKTADLRCGGVVWDVVFSPDGRWIATASEDHTARVWEADTGREVARINHESIRVSSVAFSPDGRLLATASGNAVRFHYLQPDDLMSQACGRLTLHL